MDVLLHVYFFDNTGLEPGAVGLALSYAVTLTGMFQWGVRQSAEIENMVRTRDEQGFDGWLTSI